jgi:hypothetical protein
MKNCESVGKEDVFPENLKIYSRKALDVDPAAWERGSAFFAGSKGRKDKTFLLSFLFVELIYFRYKREIRYPYVL